MDTSHNKKHAAKNYRLIFAHNVRGVRRVKNISQEALALEANVSRVYISDIEKGKRAVSIDIMSSIASALNISLIDLLNDELLITSVFSSTEKKSLDDSTQQ